MRVRPGVIAVGAVVAVAVAAGAVVVLGGGGDDAVAEECVIAAPSASAGSGGGSDGVSVVEQGWSSVYPEEPKSDFPRISVGAVLKNSTDQVAYRTRVVFDAFGADGRSVVEGVQRKYIVVEVPVIAAGAEVAVGDTVVGAERAEVARVSVTPTVTSWLSPDSADGLLPVTATITGSTVVRAADASGKFGFTVANPNCGDLFSRGVSVVWRDDAGEIVGGAVDTEFDASICEPDFAGKEISAVSPGASVPEDIAPDRAQVTPLCDLQQRAAAPGESDSPIN